MPQAASLQSVRSALDEASRAAKRIEDGAGRAAMLARIAEVWWRAGAAPGSASALAAALAGTGDIEDARNRAPALARIARARAQTGDRQGRQATAAEALASIAPEPADEVPISTLAELAMAEAAAGDFTAATARVERLADRRRRDHTLGAIAALAASRPSASLIQSGKRSCRRPAGICLTQTHGWFHPGTWLGPCPDNVRFGLCPEAADAGHLLTQIEEPPPALARFRTRKRLTYVFKGLVNRILS